MDATMTKLIARIEELERRLADAETSVEDRTEPREGTDEHIAWMRQVDEVRNQAEVIIGKQRHGPIGKVKLFFDSRYTRFGNLSGRT